MICRDRAGAYAEGATFSSPNALQGADRFHLLQTLNQAVEMCVTAYRDSLRTAAPPPDLATTDTRTAEIEMLATAVRTGPILSPAWPASIKGLAQGPGGTATHAVDADPICWSASPAATVASAPGARYRSTSQGCSGCTRSSSSARVSRCAGDR